MTDASALEALRGEVADMRSDLNLYGRGLQQLAGAVETMNSKLDVLLEATQKEAGPSPIEELLRQIVKLLQEQKPMIEAIAAAHAARANGSGQH